MAVMTTAQTMAAQSHLESERTPRTHTHSFDCICNVIQSYYMLKPKRSRRTWFLLQYLRRLFHSMHNVCSWWEHGFETHALPSSVHSFELRCCDVSAIACAAFSNIHFNPFSLFFLSQSIVINSQWNIYCQNSSNSPGPQSFCPFASTQTIDSLEMIK